MSFCLCLKYVFEVYAVLCGCFSFHGYCNLGFGTLDHQTSVALGGRAVFIPRDPWLLSLSLGFRAFGLREKLQGFT